MFQTDFYSRHGLLGKIKKYCKENLEKLILEVSCLDELVDPYKIDGSLEQARAELIALEILRVCQGLRNVELLSPFGRKKYVTKRIFE